jgi:transaldolase
MSALDLLKQHSVVVADTGDFSKLTAFAPRDATTNPSLILRAASDPQYRPLVHSVLKDAALLPMPERIDRILVRFGCEILARIAGRVSTEVDARLSFDSAATVARARRLVALYRAAGIAPARVLIKIAATWEGIRAAEVLEAEGIGCNLTLIFSLVQAEACSDAGVGLISPFVGRITDWHRKATGRDCAPDDDPGVLSVRRIWSTYKRHGRRTEVMGASFRNIGQILALAGCDLLTISPALLQELAGSQAPVPVRLTADVAAAEGAPWQRRDESDFRFALNEDAMATEKLAEGIRLFTADTLALERLLASV